MTADPIDRARQALHAIDPGCDRDAWVRAAMAAKAAGLDEGDFRDWSASGANYAGERDVRSVWRSIKPEGGIGPGTLFAMAHEAGWREPLNGHHKPQERPQAARKVNGKAASPFDADRVWRDSEPAAADHEYIRRKLGLADGLRVVPADSTLRIAGQAIAGWLAVPLFDGEAEVPATLQFIGPDAGKLTAPGPMRGWFTVGGRPTPGASVYICEGIGQAWSAHQATRSPAVVAFGAGRMESVARALLAQVPGARVVLVADVGQEAKVEASAKALGCAWVAPPADLGKNGDINDLHQRDGMAAVAALLAQAKEPAADDADDDEITGDELLALDMPDVRYLCRPWIPEGVTILAGRPKIGKTTLLRQVAVSSASGGDLWGSPCEPAEVLFLSLEEGAKLMRRKLMLAGYNRAQVRRIRFHWKWRAGVLGVGDIRAKLKAHPEIRLIIVDSLTRFRDAPTRDKPQFHQDYEAVRLLADVAKDHPGLSIIILHHTKKDQGDDPIADISGTFGLTAAADNYMVMRREGGEFVLHCGGRYWDEAEDAFRIRRDGGAWALEGVAASVPLSPMQRQYLDVLISEGTVTTRGMSRRFNVKDNTASEILTELKAKGLADRTADGWCLVSTHTPETTESRRVYERAETSET